MFRDALHDFREKLSGPGGLTLGKYSDYSVKRMLGALLRDGSLPPRRISAWPTGCPAYIERSPRLFPGLQRIVLLQPATTTA